MISHKSLPHNKTEGALNSKIPAPGMETDVRLPHIKRKADINVLNIGLVRSCTCTDTVSWCII